MAFQLNLLSHKMFHSYETSGFLLISSRRKIATGEETCNKSAHHSLQKGKEINSGPKLEKEGEKEVQNQRRNRICIAGFEKLYDTKQSPMLAMANQRPQALRCVCKTKCARHHQSIILIELLDHNLLIFFQVLQTSKAPL